MIAGSTLLSTGSEGEAPSDMIVPWDDNPTDRESTLTDRKLLNGISFRQTKKKSGLINVLLLIFNHLLNGCMHGLGLRLLLILQKNILEPQ